MPSDTLSERSARMRGRTLDHRTVRGRGDRIDRTDRSLRGSVMVSTSPYNNEQSHVPGALGPPLRVSGSDWPASAFRSPASASSSVTEATKSHRPLGVLVDRCASHTASPGSRFALLEAAPSSSFAPRLVATQRASGRAVGSVSSVALPVGCSILTPKLRCQK